MGHCAAGAGAGEVGCVTTLADPFVPSGCFGIRMGEYLLRLGRLHCIPGRQASQKLSFLISDCLSQSRHYDSRLPRPQVRPR